jgi:hypothetical protein
VISVGRWCHKFIDDLQDAFNDRFNYVGSTGKRHYLVVEVSSSMDSME